MKICIAMHYDYEQTGTLGVYSSREKALRAWPGCGVEIYDLDDVDEGDSLATWHTVDFAIRSGHGKVIDDGDAGDGEEGVVWLQWPKRDEEVVRARVLASSAEDAREKAIAMVSGKELPVSFYRYDGGANPWHDGGTKRFRKVAG